MRSTVMPAQAHVAEARVKARIRVGVVQVDDMRHDLLDVQ